MKATAAVNISTEANYTENLSGIPQSQQMKYFNKTWMMAAEAGMPKWVDQDGNYQYDRYLRARSFTKKRRVSIDVGANLGLFARRMGEDFQTVYCFEPVPQARACFSRNVSGNNCVLYPYGLGNGEYETEISYCEHSIGGSTIGRHANEGRTDGAVLAEEQIKLKIRTLDSFNFRKVDFIKIDIQGYELEMLQGAKKTLRRNNAVILVELIADGIEHVEVPKLLNSLGYFLKERIGKDGIFSKDSLWVRFTRKVPGTKIWKKEREQEKKFARKLAYKMSQKAE